MSAQDAARDERGGNRILTAIPTAQWELLRTHVEPVTLRTGASLATRGEPDAHVVFPVDCIVSLRCELADGHGSEFAMVGNEGMIGISAFTGTDAQSADALVQCPGRALRIRASVARRMFDADPAFRRVVLRYMQALLRATSQTSVCYRHHGIEQQVARILLASHDRLDSTLLPMTHEVISRMPGVRREGVTEAANMLRRGGLIEYSRGRIRLLDLPGLAERSCECYALVRDEYLRITDADPGIAVPSALPPAPRRPPKDAT